MCFSIDLLYSLLFIIIIEIILIYNYLYVKSKYANILLIYPILILINSILYKRPFIDLGDGHALIDVYRNLMDDVFISYRADYNILKIIKNLNAGFIPGYALAQLISISNCSTKVYISQNFIFFIVNYSIFIFVRRLNNAEKENIDLIFLLSCISPYMLYIGSYPSKYLILYSLLFLILNLYYAINYYNKVIYYALFITSMLALLIVKFQIFFTITFFMIIHQVILAKNRNTYYIFIPIICYFIYNFETLLSRVYLYLLNSNDELERKFGFLENFILGRFLYRLFADIFIVVPWTMQNLFDSGVSSRNIFIVALQILTTFFVLFQFINFTRNIKFFLSVGSEYSKIFSFFCIFMTLTLYFGKGGFPEYLVIYLPFLSIKWDKLIYIDTILSISLIILVNFTYYLF